MMSGRYRTTPVAMGKIPCSLMLLVLLAAFSDAVAMNLSSKAVIKRREFPSDFMFGTSSSAFQYEGAAHRQGKGPSIWDTFTENYPEKIKDGSNATIADDFYHRYKEDVRIMKNIGFDAFRLSISWPRILPRGTIAGGINAEGISFYNNLIGELLSKGITPFVTLFHWDTPQALQDAYGGFLSDRIVNDYQDYVDLCFQKFGDRVKHWITINEPHIVATFGFATGSHAPGRCSNYVDPNCTGGDSSIEPYVVAHNMLLAHATAVKTYRDKYEATQRGKIGLSLDVAWSIPYTESYEDRLAASRAVAFTFDWFMEPLVRGEYPQDMINHVKERMPRFTPRQALMLKGSFDFIGINYYTSKYAMNTKCPTTNLSYTTDSCVITTAKRNGVLIGSPTASNSFYVYPRGIRDVLLYAKYKYKDPILYITENGFNNANMGKVMLNDPRRINFHALHLSMIKSAIMLGANVKGYLVWSLLDDFEWASGYTLRFGLIFVDYKDKQKRYLKNSAKWFRSFLQGKKAYVKP